MNTMSSEASAGAYVAPTTIDEALISEKGGDTKSKDSFVRGLFQALVETVKASNDLPTGNDAEYASTYPAFKKEVEESSRDVLKLLFELLSQVSEEGVPSMDLLLSSEIHTLEDTDPELFECVSDVLDGLLVDVELRLEDAKGTKPRQQLSHVSTVLSQSSGIPKPQHKFADRLDNVRIEGTKRKTIAEEEHEAQLRNLTYRDWQLKPPNNESSKCIPLHIPDPPHIVPSNIKAIFVDTEEGLDALLVKLQDESLTEMAIDLENHSYRSFQGFGCLMQITIPSGDYIIDTLALRSAIPSLRVPFSNPSLVKVLHGCNSDVLWLQRDFGLYLVNVFDTGQAARELGLPSFGLSYLLSSYCDVQTNKAHQLSDWRLRPLSDSMLRYAQRDTRYLLYLHDVLRKKLWDRSHGQEESILRVLDASKELCQRRYRVHQFDPDGWLMAICRQPMTDDLSSTGRRVMSRLWEWRDRIAREADESVGYVMSLQLMVRIARSLPSTSDTLNRCGNPLPPLTREKSNEVLRIVSECTTIGDHGMVKQSFDSQMHKSNFMQDTATTVATASHDGGANTSSSSELAADVSSSTALETEELYRMAGWNSPVPSTECGDTKLKPRLSTGNAGINATLKMPHSLGLGENETPDNGHYVDKNREKAQQIRDEIANEPILSFHNAPDLVSLDDTNNGGMMKAEQYGEGAGDVVEGYNEKDVSDDFFTSLSPLQKRTSVSVMSSNNPTQVKQQPEETLFPCEGDIPKNVADIYRISNHNHCNKDKKGGTAVAVAQSPSDGIQTTGNLKKEDKVEQCFSEWKRHKSKDTTIIQEFMEEDTLQFVENIVCVTPQDRETMVTTTGEVPECGSGGGGGMTTTMTSASNVIPSSSITTTHDEVPSSSGSCNVGDRGSITSCSKDTREKQQQHGTGNKQWTSKKDKCSYGMITTTTTSCTSPMGEGGSRVSDELQPQTSHHYEYSSTMAACIGAYPSLQQQQQNQTTTPSSSHNLRKGQNR